MAYILTLAGVAAATSATQYAGTLSKLRALVFSRARQNNYNEGQQHRAIHFR